MDTNNHKNKLDRFIENGHPGPMAKPNFTTWAKQHETDIDYLKAQALTNPTTGSSFMRFVRFAAAVLIITGLGFWGGRLSSGNRPDLTQLRAELEASLTQQCLGAVEAGHQQLRQDILIQLHQDTEVLAGQILSATRQLTDQQVLRMIRLIDEVRLRDRQHIAAAFAQLESKRLQDIELLNESLQAMHQPKPESKQLH
jgi:hypothetical protein